MSSAETEKTGRSPESSSAGLGRGEGVEDEDDEPGDPGSIPPVRGGRRGGVVGGVGSLRGGSKWPQFGGDDDVTVAANAVENGERNRGGAGEQVEKDWGGRQGTGSMPTLSTRGIGEGGAGVMAQHRPAGRHGRHSAKHCGEQGKGKLPKNPPAHFSLIANGPAAA